MKNVITKFEVVAKSWHLAELSHVSWPNLCQSFGRGLYLQSYKKLVPIYFGYPEIGVCFGMNSDKEYIC